MIWLKPTSMQDATAGGGGGAMSSSVVFASISSLFLFFALLRLPLDGLIYVLRYWPMGERKLQERDVCQNTFRFGMAGYFLFFPSGKKKTEQTPDNILA